MSTFHCSVCGQDKDYQDTFTTGYAVRNDNTLVCYDCCAVLDKQTMITDGHSKRLPLYLSKKLMTADGSYQWKITNWPGSLEFTAYYSKTSCHNFGCKREDIWFKGPDGFVWHGYQIGNNTQIVHCKRTKEKNR